MKKLNTIISILFVTLLLAGCGSKASGPASTDSAASESTASESVEQRAESSEFSVESLHTVGDVMKYEDLINATSYDEEQYVCVLDLDGIYYRIVVPIPEDVSKAIWSVDVTDEKFDENAKEQLSALEITGIENLSEGIPSQEELDKLVGKTGEDLLEDGWIINGYNLEAMEFWMWKGPYAYTVIFDGQIDPAESEREDFNDLEAVSPLTIKSVTCDGIGDGTIME